MDEKMIQRFLEMFGDQLIETQRTARRNGVNVIQVELKHPKEYEFVHSAGLPNKILGIEIIWKHNYL